RVPTDVALVLADPVDPGRNVSSALSRQNLATLILAARAYLGSPNRDAFRPRTPASVPRSRGLELAADRGTHVAVLRLPRPGLVDDILYPQPRRAERGLRETAERLGFEPLGTGVGADDASLVVAIEVAHGRLPAVRPRDGPPVGLDRAG